MNAQSSYAEIYVYERGSDGSPTGHVATKIVVEGEAYFFELQLEPNSPVRTIPIYNEFSGTPGLEEFQSETVLTTGYWGALTNGAVDGEVRVPANAGRVAAVTVPISMSAAQAQDALRFAMSQMGASGYVLTSNNCKTFVDAVLAAGGYTGDWTSMISVGALGGHSLIELILPSYYDTVTEKLATEFPDILTEAFHELNTGGNGPTVEYVRAVLSGDTQAIARTAMDLTGGRLNLYDGMDPSDVGVYPDLILRAAAGITTISDDNDDDDEQSARELIEQIKDEGMSPTAPEPARPEPAPRTDPAGRTPDDPRYTGPQPILLDLDGNGIRITEQSRSGMFVDAGGDGLLHRTAWAGAGDGVLFYDPDGTGAITEKRQYVFTEWDPTATDDLAALRSVFDSNGDGVLNASDAAFASFKVMVTNADGSTTAMTLAQLGITEINLTADATRIVLPDGSVISGQTSFTRSNGSTGTVANATLVAEAQGHRVEQVQPKYSSFLPGPRSTIAERHHKYRRQMVVNPISEGAI